MASSKREEQKNMDVLFQPKMQQVTVFNYNNSAHMSCPILTSILHVQKRALAQYVKYTKLNELFSGHF